MPLLLSDYVQQVRDLGYDGLNTALIERAVQQARRRLFAEYRWSWLSELDTSIVTLANHEELGMLWPVNYLYTDSIRLLDGDYRIPLDFLPYERFRELTAGSPQPGTPQVYTQRNSDVRFWPIPAGAFTVELVYVRDPGPLPDLTTDIIPDTLADLVVWAAVVPLAFRQRELNAASAADQHYSRTLLPRAIKQDKTQQRQRSDRVNAWYHG